MSGVQAWWERLEKWWKGFYLTFLVALPLLVLMSVPLITALSISALWAATAAGALWFSEKLKDQTRR